MTFSLAAIVRRQRNVRRRAFVFRPIQTTGVQAVDLYRAAYEPFIALWTSALPRIEAEYARSLSGLTSDSAADIGNIITEVQGMATLLMMRRRSFLQAMFESIEAWHRGKWRSAILSATGVDMGTMLGPEAARETLGAAIERNVGLIRSVSEEAQRRITDIVFSGLTQRRPANDVAKDIREAVDMSRARARRIASDQIVKVASALDQERRREAGLDVFRWHHSAKLHPREEHLARNGKLFSEREARVGTEVRGQIVRAAPEPGDMPGQPPFCGCTSSAVLVLD